MLNRPHLNAAPPSVLNTAALTRLKTRELTDSENRKWKVCVDFLRDTSPSHSFATSSGIQSQLQNILTRHSVKSLENKLHSHTLTDTAHTHAHTHTHNHTQMHFPSAVFNPLMSKKGQCMWNHTTKFSSVMSQFSW